MRDLFFATPEGVVLSRPAAIQRAGEERHVAEILAAMGVPILLSPRGKATFEGADALWLDRSTVIIGVGLRTNPEGAAQVSGLLHAMEVETVEIPMPEGVQHLLGIVNFVDKNLAVLHAGKATDRLRTVLAQRGIDILELSDDEEVSKGRAMNFVTLGPRRLVMPAGCPGVRERYRAEGIEVFEVDVSEYLKAAGGPGCLTGILRRD